MRRIDRIFVGVQVLPQTHDNLYCISKMPRVGYQACKIKMNIKTPGQT